MTKDTFYFSHDYNTRNDIKIKHLLSKCGYEGYGIFWSLIEDLYNNTNVLRLDYETLSFDLRCDEKLVKSIINDFDLFIIDGEIFGSHSVQRRLEERNSKSIKARESVLKRWNKIENNTNVLPTNNDSNTIKERKGKEKKVKEIKIFIPPTFQEFEIYFKENGFSNIAKKVYDYYSSANWHDSKGNKVLSWKQKVQGVWFKDENKENIQSKIKDGRISGGENDGLVC